MNFLSFMVYFRGGELYFSSPLVRSDKEPALPFSGPTLATVTTEEQSPYAWRWEHSACIIYNTLSLVKTGLLFNVNSFMYPCRALGVGESKHTLLDLPPKYLSR